MESVQYGENGMRFFPAALFLMMSLSVSAQTADAIYQRACGPKAASFNVQVAAGQPPTSPEPGKALVFFIQKQSGTVFTTRVGLNGAWVGVLQQDSYFAVSVAPGEQHACAATLNRNRLEAELVHFTVEA